jgi:hypothetical protein
MAYPFIAAFGNWKAIHYEDGLVWLHHHNQDLRLPKHVAAVYLARLQMDDDMQSTLRQAWQDGIAYWRKYGVTDQEQVGNAIEGAGTS